MVIKPSYIKNARRKLGLTQTEFGEELGLTKRTIIRYEVGDTPIPEHLRLSVRWLVEKKKPPADRQPTG